MASKTVYTCDKCKEEIENGNPLGRFVFDLKIEDVLGDESKVGTVDLCSTCAYDMLSTLKTFDI